MSFFDLLVGKPLATSEERAEHIGPIAGIPVFGLDALSSAAYGPEAALTLLIPLGVAGIAHIVPISFAIIGLLAIVFFSYRQTIDAYPHGGGSYTVASENLGDTAGLLAAAALMIDYILNAAVGISAGVGALVSAFPTLQPHTLALCLVILVILTLDQHARRQGHRLRLPHPHLSLRRNAALHHHHRSAPRYRRPRPPHPRHRAAAPPRHRIDAHPLAPR